LPRPTPPPTLFPYTTLFRSRRQRPARLRPRPPRSHRARPARAASVPAAAERPALRAHPQSVGDAQGARAERRSEEPRDAAPAATRLNVRAIEGWPGFAGPPRALAGESQGA